MPGAPITASSVLTCPHLGSVQIISTNTRVMARSGALTTKVDGFAIVGCPNQPPCTMVQFVGNPRVLVNGQPAVFYPGNPLDGICNGTPPGPVILLPVPSSIGGT